MWWIFGFIGFSIVTWILFALYEAFCSDINIAVETSPLDKLTIVYKMSKKRVISFNSDFEGFRVINICYKGLDASMEEMAFYAVGIIIHEGEIDPRHYRNEVLSLMGFKVFCIPPSTLAVTSTFQFTNFLSFRLGIHRLYRHMQEHIDRHHLCAYPKLEIYTKYRVRVYMPLTRQTQYYVPEATPPPKWEWCITAPTYCFMSNSSEPEEVEGGDEDETTSIE